MEKGKTRKDKGRNGFRTEFDMTAPPGVEWVVSSLIYGFRALFPADSGNGGERT
jgi:hypothetical protein